MDDLAPFVGWLAGDQAPLLPAVLAAIIWMVWIGVKRLCATINVESSQWRAEVRSWRPIAGAYVDWLTSAGGRDA